MSVARWILLACVLAGEAAAENAEPAEPSPVEAAAEHAELAEPPPIEAVQDSVDETAAVPELPARGRYNLGIDQLAEGDAEAAAESFLTARDQAGADPQLRYRAAFNLGFALAAGIAPEAPPGEVIETLRQSAAWFNDAVRLAPPGDDDARINLELVSRRILQLADQLNEGDKLETRLDRLIDDQRSLRDQLRHLLTDLVIEEAGTEPLGFKSEFDALASRERTLVAEVGDCIDLATEERLFIEQSPPEQRTPEQQSRAYQLAGVADYLERARQSLADARRRLRRLEGEQGHRRADAALRELKRAREQLRDPVTVLQAAARDEVELIGHTSALAAFQRGAIDIDESQPPWLTGKHLAERQEDIGARAGGVLSRFEAAAVASSEADAAAMRAILAATPILDRSVAAMRGAIAALRNDEASSALADQREALRTLRQAIEQFADVKGLVELAFADQSRIVALLTPDEAGVDDLAPNDRAMAIGDLAGENQRRLVRLETLLQEEAAAAMAAGEGAEEGEEAPSEEALEVAQRRFDHAEILRAQAVAGLRTLGEEIQRIAANEAQPAKARTAAGDTLGALDELRRLFFSIIEHLRALHADQADTHDQTATLQFESAAQASEALPVEIGLAAERQARHEQVGDALAAALAEQADRAADAATDDGAEQTGERLAEAAGEVRKAGGRMQSAALRLADAAERANAMSPELEPALADQLAALEHLENALRALLPDDERGEENQASSEGGAQQQAQQQPPPAEDERISQRQALKRLQAIRDREAERQRRRTNPVQPAPVEKDW